MSGEINEPSVREQRVDDAIAAYLEAMDAGETPDSKEFIAAHSDISAELESFFANRDEFERMAEPLQPAGATAPRPQADDPTLPPTDEPTEPPTLRSTGDILKQGESLMTRSTPVTASACVLALSLYLGCSDSTTQLAKGRSVGDTVTADDEGTDIDKIQGMWGAVSYVENGQGGGEIVDARESAIRFIFEADKFTILASGNAGESPKGTFKLAPTKKPKSIDMVFSPSQGEQTTLGIYEFEGPTLKLCFGSEHAKRPTEFKSHPSSGHKMVVFERLDVSAGEPAGSNPVSARPASPQTGTNLIRNASLEDAELGTLPRGWSAYPAGAPNFRCEVVTGGHTGKQCLEIEHDKLKVLDRYLGLWQSTHTQSTPVEETMTGELTYRRVLGGRFVQEQVELSDMSTDMVMYTYDTEQKCYRSWRFPSKGQPSEATGQWDADTKTITWAVVGSGPEFTTIVRTRFVNDNTFEYDFISKDGEGEVLFRLEGRATRAGDSKK